LEEKRPMLSQWIYCRQLGNNSYRKICQHL